MARGASFWSVFRIVRWSSDRPSPMDRQLPSLTSRRMSGARGSGGSAVGRSSGDRIRSLLLTSGDQKMAPEVAERLGLMAKS